MQVWLGLRGSGDEDGDSEKRGMRVEVELFKVSNACMGACESTEVPWLTR